MLSSGTQTIPCFRLSRRVAQTSIGMVRLFPVATLGCCFSPLSFLLVVWRSDLTWHLLENDTLHHSEDEPITKQATLCLSKNKKLILCKNYLIWNFELSYNWCRDTDKPINLLMNKNMFFCSGEKMIDWRQLWRWNCSAAFLLFRITKDLFPPPFAPSSVYSSICLSCCRDTQKFGPPENDSVAVKT